MFDEWTGWIRDNFTSPWGSFLVVVALSMVIGLIGLAVIGGIAKRSRSKLAITIASRLRSAIFVGVSLAGVSLGLRSFDIAPELMARVDVALTMAIAILVTWALTRVYTCVHDSLITKWAKRTKNSELADVGRKVITMLIWVLGLSSGLNSAGFDIGAIIAGLGIGGLAVALAAQDAVANIFGGVIILSQEPFKVGDRVDITGVDGWVTEIGLRATTIKNWHGHKITVPNKLFTNNAVANIDDRGEYWEEIPLRLRHDTSLAQVKTAMSRIKKIIVEHEHLRDRYWVGVSKLGDGFIEIEVWYGIISYYAEGGQAGFPEEYSKQSGVRSDINLAVLGALEEEGIHLATPVSAHILHQGTLGEGRF